MNNKEIAKEIDISEQTLYNWMSHITFKTALLQERISYLQSVQFITMKPFTDLVNLVYTEMGKIMREGTFEEKFKIIDRIWEDVHENLIHSSAISQVFQKEFPGQEEIDAERLEMSKVLMDMLDESKQK